MDDKALKDAIREAGGIVHSDGNIFFTNADQFKKAAALSHKAEAPGWILASNLLPEVEQRVLMTMDAWDGEVDIGQHLREGKFYCGDRSYFYPERTRWMPLPAAPKDKP